ncbi:hypothetical protein HHL19_16475 [Streptomyces sp. R302]|uniref:hypothetical protein n=1 Tax=unclassified Streptomyces TaxID=2593676 RepID=UPI00145D1A9D|nr:MULTISPECIES: hypothetical protein [unclassified Streptomyces]NML55365.1 hypothetical protein [Streptomyces sp. R301]NML80237.1 hypothetical protein [Streptomyces sp. R302]
MHTAPDVSDYEWPTCTNPRCGRALWPEEAHRHVCRPCEQTVNRLLGELPALFVRLSTTSALLRRVGNRSAAASGRDTPPIPGRLEVLDLTGPGGAAARLQAIEDSWRAALGRRIGTWAGSPAQALPVHVTFLRINLEWACEQYAAVDQDLEVIRRLHRDCTTAVSGTPRPAHVGIGTCPARDADGALCGEDLSATTAHHRIHCPRCGARWDGLADWRTLRRAQEAAAASTALMDEEPTEFASQTLEKATAYTADDDDVETGELPVYAYSGGAWVQR